MVFIVQSTKFIHQKTMTIATGADLIFYKPVTNGFLYVLKFKKDNEKKHVTVNNCIIQLDETLKLSSGRNTTCFLSINDDNTLPGSKVLSFDREGRKANPLFRQLFDRNEALLPGVTIWNKEIGDVAELSDVDMDVAPSGGEEEVSEGVVTANAPSSKGKQRAIENSNESLYPHDSMQGCSVLQAEKVI